MAMGRVWVEMRCRHCRKVLGEYSVLRAGSSVVFRRICNNCKHTTHMEITDGEGTASREATAPLK